MSPVSICPDCAEALVAAGPAGHPHFRGAVTEHLVVAVSSAQPVITGVTVEDVVSPQSDDHVISGGPVDGVVALGPDDGGHHPEAGRGSGRGSRGMGNGEAEHPENNYKTGPLGPHSPEPTPSSLGV